MWQTTAGRLGACALCYEKGARSGIILASAPKLNRHADTTRHRDAAAAVGARQVDLVEAGFEPSASVELSRKRARQLAAAHMISLGVPYSSSPRLPSR